MLRLVDNPVSRFPGAWTEWEVPPPPATLSIYADESRSILSRNDSPDLHFRWSVNPYRGCFHGCAYCYARPSHEYLGFGSGTDFERKLVVKPNAAELLRSELTKPSWNHEFILFSGNTDCYQPIELEFELTQACLKVCGENHTPVGIITKASLVERDAALLAELAQGAGAEVTLSIPFDDPVICRMIEPGAPPPARRYRTIAALAAAGVPVGVNIAPLVPGFSDADVPKILQRCRESGARFARLLPVRLPGAVEEIFAARVREGAPLRAEGVLAKIRRMRGGPLNDSRFGKRFVGQGNEWEAVEQLFQVWHRRLGYEERPERAYSPAKPPVRKPPLAQLSLFPSK